MDVDFLLVVHSFASWSEILLPEISVCALIFCIAMLCFVHRSWWTVVEIRSFSRWLCWDEGGKCDC